MNITIFAWTLSPDDKQLAEKFIKSVYPDSNTEIHELGKSPAPKIATDLAIAFGRRAHSLAVAANPKKTIHEFPKLSDLSATTGTKESRLAAHKKLKGIKESKLDIAEDITLTDKDLERFLSKQLTALQKTLKAEKVKLWKGTTATGRSIAITLKPTTKVDDCEIVLTFEELFAAKYAVETLGVDSLTLIGNQ